MATSPSPYYTNGTGAMPSPQFSPGMDSNGGSSSNSGYAGYDGGTMINKVGGFNNNSMVTDSGPSGGGGGDLTSLNFDAYNGLNAVNGLVVDGVRVDGSWELSVAVEDFPGEVKVRVRGDLHIGGLMHRISEAVNIQQSWADHAIWWSERNMWLLHHRTTLDQYGVQSDARLVFRRMHGNAQIVLPSMAVVTMRLNFSVNVFTVTRNVCSQFNIRHPEELSLSFPVRRNDIKKNNPLPIIRHGTKKCAPLTSIGNARSDMPSAHHPRQGESTIPRTPLVSYGGSRMALDSTGTMGRPTTPYGTLAQGSRSLLCLQSDNSLDRGGLDLLRYADCSQRRQAKAIFGDGWLVQPKTLQQKARLHSGWLDSSRSLMEHGIEPPTSLQETGGVRPPTLYLRFKFFDFYDLNLKYDAVRIHQLFEQARWSLLAAHLECTEAEMIVFAAFQLQAEIMTATIPPALVGGFGDTTSGYPTLGHGGMGTIGGTNYGTLGAPLSPDLSSNRRHFSPLASNYAGGSLLHMHTPLTPRSMLSVPDMTIGSGTTLQRMQSTLSGAHNANGTSLDEVDEMLSELEQSCGVKSDSHRTPLSHLDGANSPRMDSSFGQNIDMSAVDTAVIPTLEDQLRISRDRVFGMRRYKELWAVVREGGFCLFKSRDESRGHQPVCEYSLRDCRVTSEVDVSAGKFVIKLSLVPTVRGSTPSSAAATAASDGNAARCFNASGSHPNGLNVVGTVSRHSVMSGPREEIWLRCTNGEQYARWTAAFQLGSRGKTLASKAAYDREVEAVTESLRLQRPGPTAISPAEAAAYLTDLSDFCADRIVKRARSKDALRQRICEAMGNMSELSLLEAKMKYIRTWQKLPQFGRTYFIVFFDKLSGPSAFNPSLVEGVVGEQLLAVYQGRVEVVSSTNGEVQRAWNFSDMRSWNVNWDIGRVVLEFRNGQVTFRPLSANCKTVVEFIGGYVFLSQRTPEKNQELNERMFHRLTCVSD